MCILQRVAAVNWHPRVDLTLKSGAGVFANTALPCVDIDPRKTIDKGQYVFVSAVRHVIILFGPIPRPPIGWNSDTKAGRLRPKWPDLPSSYRLVLPTSPECAVEVVLAKPRLARADRDRSADWKRFVGALPQYPAAS
jgi:hypothetical protein